jgi:hypothetical protein
MATIEQIIQRDPNPFDTETFWSGNFWQEEQDPALTVDSIHQGAIAQIEALLDRVAADNRTRTLMLEGETGSGKTYLLGRLKRFLNPKAFFVYIEPFTASDYIWRHILRYTVDSLLEVPEGQQDSQLLIWLQGLSEFRQRSIMDWLRGERQVFVRNLLETYPSGIYNAQEFFGVLYDLTNPKLAPLACEWLRGDDLDEESLTKLGVQHSIETEDAAQKILANFGRIAAATQPIVLCFDQLDNIARLNDGAIDLQTLFNVNTVIQNQKLKNFLVIISIITDTWRQNANRIHQTDRDRINETIQLKQITLDQSEALWASRLYVLHRQTYPQPQSPIFPLTRAMLEEKFPGGKTRPRNVLILGRQLFQEAKIRLLQNDIQQESQTPPLPGLPERKQAPTPAEAHSDALAAFKLVWLQKFNQIEQRITRIRQYSAPELIQMLAEALAALQVEDVRPRLLPSRTYASYSICYQLSALPGQIGVVWTEDRNMVKFYNLMKSCQEAIDQGLCQTLQLIRAEGVGSSANQGYKLYSQIFSDSPHNHLMPDLNSVHYLATYHTLVNDARSGELVVGDRTPDRKDLERLIRESQILENCDLLQELGVFAATASDRNGATELKPVEEFLVNRVINQQCIARERLEQEALSQFSEVKEFQVRQLIDRLCQQNGQIQLLDPDANVEEQLVYLVKQ